MNKYINNKADERGQANGDERANIPAPPSMDFDVEPFMTDMDDMDIGEDQKRAFLETLCAIMRTFVELGFSVDLCAQLFDDFNEVSDPDSAGGKVSDPIETETPSPPHGKEPL